MTAQSPRLSGAQCRCTTCGRAFKSEHAFDQHRITVTPAPRYSRRCMTDAELNEAGLQPNAAGFYRVPFNHDRLRGAYPIEATAEFITTKDHA